MRSRRTLALVMAAAAATASVFAVPTSALAKVTAPSGITNPSPETALGKADPPPVTTTTTVVSGVTRTSVRSGNWNDPGTWSGTQVPAATAAAVVAPSHVVTVTADVAVAGVTVQAGATLRADPAVNATVASSRNVVVQGILQLRPASATVNHVLRFVNVNEASFVGGGMNPVASDVGLWVMGDGQLDLAGTPKTAWTRAAGPIAAGATSVALIGAPGGWRAGDEVVIAPTQAPTVGDASWAGFDQAAVASVSSSTVSLASAVSRPHPMVNGQWTAEVMNLTRNVRLEGTATGRSHVFIRSTRPQSILHTAIRYMGPRKGGDLVLGRYGLHFHFSLDGSRGSQVLGTVIRDTDSHAFVPHQSHGITFKDDISFNTTEDAYWWDPNTAVDKEDPGELSNDTVMDHNVAALVKAGSSSPTRLAGFVMAEGNNNVVRDSVAVGVQGSRDASGFKWPEKGAGVWDFSRGNIAHNNRVDGIFNWENGGPTRVIANFVAYHNGEAGIDHGAYFNRFRFENIYLYGNGRTGVELKAVSGIALEQAGVVAAEQLRFDNLVIDGAGISPELVTSVDHNAPGINRPTVFRNTTFLGAPVAIRMGGNVANHVDVESSFILTPTDVAFVAGAAAGDLVRIEAVPVAAIEITPTGRRSIPPFASFVDTSPPEGSILSPIGGSQVSGTVSVTTAGYDLVGVTRIEFSVNGVLHSTAETAEPTFSWSTAGLAAGAHTIQVRAIDAAGNTNDPALVTVFVQ